MTQYITVSTSYYTGGAAVVDLSHYKWEDVHDWYVKWDRFHVRFKGSSEWVGFELNTDTSEGTDWKRPVHTDIYEGEWEFENELASMDG